MDCIDFLLEPADGLGLRIRTVSVLRVLIELGTTAGLVEPWPIVGILLDSLEARTGRDFSGADCYRGDFKPFGARVDMDPGALASPVDENSTLKIYKESWMLVSTWSYLLQLGLRRIQRRRLLWYRKTQMSNVPDG